jgi:anti-anti-sigma regulatory factor
MEGVGEGVNLLELSAEPEMGDDLKRAITSIRNGEVCNLILDFSEVDIITNSSLSKLLKIRKALADIGCRLVLSKVAAATKGIFFVTALEGIFEIAADNEMAVQDCLSSKKRKDIL